MCTEGEVLNAALPAHLKLSSETLLLFNDAYGDGWYALTGTKYGDEFEFIPKFQHMLSDAGREPASCPITICLYPEELDMHAPDQVGALKRYQDLGVTRCIVGLKTDKAPANLPTLDRWANFMRRMRSA